MTAEGPGGTLELTRAQTQLCHKLCHQGKWLNFPASVSIERDWLISQALGERNEMNYERVHSPGPGALIHPELI